MEPAIFQKLTIINNRFDKEMLARAFVSRFVMDVTQIDWKSNYVIEKYDGYYDELSIIRYFQEKYVIYGYAYLFSDLYSDPCFGGDISDVRQLFPHLEHYSYRKWICDRAFSWCIEFYPGHATLVLSPYAAIVVSVRRFAGMLHSGSAPEIVPAAGDGRPGDH
ncbi:MAG: hypothetical protein LBR29_08875 [Methylobacteriaceae bacterium]|jgi:hypothetical protein|nr:hypothetical protein [Methylobacteriaceae bacterium]